MSEIAAALRRYGLSKIIGDRFAGIWPVEVFAKFGIVYEQSARPKSDIYRDQLPLLSSRRVELLDHSRLLGQLANLERRVGRSGRDIIDHPAGAAMHDDCANAAGGVLVLAAQQQHRRLVRRAEYLGAPLEELTSEGWREVAAPPRTRIRTVYVMADAPAARGKC